jgi:hypothetical protein
MAGAAVVAWMLGANWNALGRGLIPELSVGESPSGHMLFVFAVGIFSARDEPKSSKTPLFYLEYWSFDTISPDW